MKKDYVIVQTRWYSDKLTPRKSILVGENKKPIVFPTRKAAGEYEKTLKRTSYLLSPQEECRPDYKIVSLDDLPIYLKQAFVSI